MASLWELVLKARKPGALLDNPVVWWDTYVPLTEVGVLPIRIPHVRRVATLPELRKDPFDRILAAQAIEENLAVITRDPIFAAYGVPVVWD